MSERWYYTHGGTVLGPASASELQRLADAGALSPTDLIWPAGSDPTAAVPAEAALRFTALSEPTAANRSAAPEWLAGLTRAIEAVDDPASLPSAPPASWLADVRRAEERSQID